MDEQQFKKKLQNIATEAIPDEIDLWPTLQAEISRRQRPLPNSGGLLLRLAGGSVALAAVAFLLFWLASLSQISTAPVGVTAVPLADIPAAIAATLTYPEAPAVLPRYQVHINQEIETPAEALAWAQDFGLLDAQLFRDPRSPESLLAIGSDGQRLSFYETEHGWTSIGYRPTDWFDAAEGRTLSMSASTAVAELFLNGRDLSPSPYLIRDLPSNMFLAGGYPPRILLAAPDLAGYALYGSNNAAVGTMMLIEPDASVFSAAFLQADFEEIGTISIRPAQDVVADFVNGRLQPLHMQITPAAGEYRDLTRYYPPLPQHTIGESVTVLETDDTHFLVAEDSSEIRATLRTRAGAKYELFTSDLTEIVEQIEYSELRVTGTIVGQSALDTWQLEVETWEILPQQAFVFSGCAVGSVEIDESGVAWIVAEDVLGQVARNGRYQIPNIPTAIQDGEYIEVCTEPMLEASETLTWQVIYVPPRHEIYADGTLQEPIAFEQTASPYDIGATAVLTGVVTHDILYQDGTGEPPWLMLVADLPGEEIGHIYPLRGPAAQLQTIADAYVDQYVQVTGTITTTAAGFGTNHAITIGSVTQPWLEPLTSAYVENTTLALARLELDEIEAEYDKLAQDLLVVETLELAYYFDPTGESDTAVPVWVVRGHSQDKQNRFLAYLPAVEA